MEVYLVSDGPGLPCAVGSDQKSVCRGLLGRNVASKMASDEDAADNLEKTGESRGEDVRPLRCHISGDAESSQQT